MVSKIDPITKLRTVAKTLGIVLSKRQAKELLTLLKEKKEQDLDLLEQVLKIIMEGVEDE